MIGRAIGNYLIQDQIGRGGQGTVYVAAHPRMGRRVAIKVIGPGLSREPAARLFAEARSASAIRNEHIVEILDCGELDDGTCYSVMEWLEGRTLAEALRAERPFAPARAVHIARGIGEALAAAHARGIIHRDLKPSNVFLVEKRGDTDFAKVLDFGIAKFTDGDLAADVETISGTMVGTPAYMAPEQCRGRRNGVDARADIYALGVLLYEMLTGRLPFSGGGLGDLLLEKMTGVLAPPRSLEPSIPSALDRAVVCALARERERRFPDIAAFMAALSATGELGWSAPPRREADPIPGGAPTESRSTGAPAPPLRRRWVAVAGALVAALALSLLAANRWTRTSRAAGRSEAPPATPARDVARAAPSEAHPAVVHLKLSAAPAEARLLLDDAPIQNPFEGSFLRGDVRHRLEARAPGRRAEVRWIAFDRDAQIALTLAPENQPKSQRRPPTVAQPASETPREEPAGLAKQSRHLITEFPEAR
jgi:serine/threonine-protein kinase